MKQKIYLLALIGASVFALVFLYGRFGATPEVVPQEAAEEAVVTESETFTVEQTVAADEVNPQTESFQVRPGQTALDLLNSSRIVQTKEYDFGLLVESIDGIENGEEEKYWILYINDEPATVGADAYQLKSGDHVRWSFEAYEE